MPLMPKLKPKKKIRSIDDLRMASKEFDPDQSGDSQDEQDAESKGELSNSGKHAKKSGGVGNKVAAKVAPVPQVSGKSKA